MFDKFFLGPELFIQQYSYKYPNTGISNASGEDKNTEANLLISFVNELSKPSKGSTFLTGGLGQYGIVNKNIGINLHTSYINNLQLRKLYECL